MKTRAVIATGPGKVEIKEYQIPPLGKQDMLAKVDMAGICGTDLHRLYDLNLPQKSKMSYPFFLGHEWTGTIVEMGEDFPRIDPMGNKLKIGDRVAVYHYRWACGKCYFCKVLAQPNLCSREHSLSSIPRIGGAFSEFQYISGKSSVYKVPDCIPLEVSVLMEPFASSLRAFERSFIPGIPDRFQGMGPGKIVLILGSGPIGMLMVALSKLCGAWKTIVIGAPEFRLKICKELGADYTINIEKIKTSKERVKIVKEMTPHKIGVDIVIEVAGVPSAFADALELIRRGGTLVEAGHYTDRGVVTINPLTLCYKDVHLFGSWGCGPAEFGSVLKIMDTYYEKMNLKKIVTHKFTLNQINEALKTAKSRECGKVIVLPECCGDNE